MLTEGIKVGDRIEISGKVAHGSRYFLSRVEEVIDDNRIVASIPIAHGSLIKLDLDKEYNFLFFTDRGMYRNSAKIVKYFKEDGFNLMQVAITSAGEKIQRRSYYRHATIMPVRLICAEDGIIEAERIKLLKSKDAEEGLIKDIGGGGIRFICSSYFKEGERIACGFTLDNEFMSPEAVVLHQQEQANSNYKYQYRVSFINTSTQEKERIVQYIFSEQRKLLKKNFLYNRG